VFEAVEALIEEHAALEDVLADPSLHADQARARKVNQRYAELSAIVRAYRDWQRLGEDATAARELGADDPDFAAEATQLDTRRAVAEERLRHLLIPRDPSDGKDAILEVKSGEGGEESALFAGDLLRMYSRYAEQHGWSTEILDATESDLGGYKSVTVAVKAKGTPAPGEAPYALLKFEAGVHRVQRVPVTESQGRVHTSAAGVLVMPEAEPVDVSIDEKDLRIDVFRSSGPGGQSVNTTDSAVRITHVPTGIVVSCQNEKSQLQNREQAMRILRARLLAAAQEEADAEASDARRSQVRTVDRSERIRTYNYAENRISDHRTGYKAYNLDQVLDGALHPVIESCLSADLGSRLEALGACAARRGGPAAARGIGHARRRRGAVARPRRRGTARTRHRPRACGARARR
jgi:peptide chain release factor 1